MGSLEDISSIKQLSIILGVRHSVLTYYLYEQNIENRYFTFQIPKKNGDFRIINSPEKGLMHIQRNLNKYLINIVNQANDFDFIVPKVSHGFVEGKSIITNSEIHVNKKYVMNIDLKDFFDSVHFGRVKGFFNKNKYFLATQEISTVLAQLTCFHGKLPQGAPTSPTIGNLIFNIVDMKIIYLARKYKLDYTRYADDLTFSTNDHKIKSNCNLFLLELKKIIEKNGFKINEEKTSFMDNMSRHVVTGLTVNKKINVNRTYLKNTRAMVESLYKGEVPYSEKDLLTLNQINGRLSFIKHVHDHKLNKKIEDSSAKVTKFTSVEQTYKKFLFYKYFLNSDNPMVITEGKTDSRYLKAALKKYWKLYPNLITKENDKYIFKISILKHGSNFANLLGLSDSGGGNKLADILWYYKGNKNYPNFVKQYKEKSENNYIKNPSIVLFDNELGGKKPLNHFIKMSDISKQKIEDFEDNLFTEVKDKLYILTHDTPSHMKGDSEIEDLFDIDTLNIEIDGRKFDRNRKSGEKDTFGKNEFSIYILNNYEDIDFKNFKPLLNRLAKIIEMNRVDG